MKFYRVAILTLALAIFAFYLAGCGQQNQEAGTATPAIAENELDPAVWGKYYPQQYQSYLKNNEEEPTEFGGSVPFDRLARYPYLKTLFAGYGFSIEYNEDRGHTYSLQDVLEIKRKKPSASCMTCKSPSVPGLIKEKGDAYYTTPFDEIAKEVKHPIACADCHDPKTMALRITRPGLIDAFKRRGEDITKASRQEMRTLVCAQCHVEYYFQKDSLIVTFPWDKGVDPDSVYKYYQELGFKDWEYPETGTPMLKAQHPEYEMFIGGTHGTAGVACADCHMPYQKVGEKKISSHQWTSPLKTLANSCGACHREGEDWLRSRVLNTQKKTAELEDKAGQSIVEAVYALKEAVKTPGADANLLQEARELHREAQWQFDWVAAENSMGFHNAQQAMYSLGKSLDLARQAQLKAKEAVYKARQ